MTRRLGAGALGLEGRPLAVPLIILLLAVLLERGSGDTFDRFVIDLQVAGARTHAFEEPGVTIGLREEGVWVVDGNEVARGALREAVRLVCANWQDSVQYLHFWHLPHPACPLVGVQVTGQASYSAAIELVDSARGAGATVFLLQPQH